MVDCQLDILNCDLPERNGRSIVFDVNTPWCQEHRVWIKKKPPHNLPLWHTREFCDYLGSQKTEVPCFIEVRYTDSPVDDLKHKGHKEELVGLAKVDLMKLILRIEANPLMKHLDLVDVLEPRLVGKIYVRIHCNLWRDLEDILWRKTPAATTAHSPILAAVQNSEVEKNDTSEDPLDSALRKYFEESLDSPLFFGNSHVPENNPPQTSVRDLNLQMGGANSPHLFVNAPDVVRIRNIMKSYSGSGNGPFSPNHAANSTKSPVKLLEKASQKRAMSDTSASPKRYFISVDESKSSERNAGNSEIVSRNLTGHGSSDGMEAHVGKDLSGAHANQRPVSRRIVANIFGEEQK